MSYVVNCIEMEEMMVELLTKRSEKNSQLPQSIVYFRDGVGEGNYSRVIGSELTSLKDACEKFRKGYKPRFVVVIVSKRHHTRFFPNARSDEDRSGNVKAGTVVDNGICDPLLNEFYLLSHAGLQGTSRPTKYTIVHDDRKDGIDIDEFQTMVYHLCYLMCRCTRSVSVPPASFYAHIVAFRARVLLFGSEVFPEHEKNFHEHKNLQNIMYFV